MTNLVQRYIGEMGGPGRAGNAGAPGFSCCTRACCVVTVSVSAPVYRAVRCLCTASCAVCVRQSLCRNHVYVVASIQCIIFLFVLVIVV